MFVKISVSPGLPGFHAMIKVANSRVGHRPARLGDDEQTYYLN